MNPKEKAEELIGKFQEHAQYWDCYNDVPLEEKHSKQCALICVDELIELYEFEAPYRGFKISYWDEVKQEIEKL